MRWILASLLALSLAVLAYFFLTSHPAEPAPAPPPRAAVAVLTPAPAETPPAAPAPEQAPAATTPPKPLQPMVSRVWSAEQDALGRRALAGDGKAAMQWQEVDDSCRLVQATGKPDMSAYFGDDTNHILSAPPRYAQITLEEHAMLADTRLELSQRQDLAAEIALRVEALCKDYVTSDAAERYAIAEIAARKGTVVAFWRFVRQPPLAADDTARQREWSKQVGSMLEARSEKDDAEAVFTLGMAYARDGKTPLPRALPPGDLLNRLMADDPVQAYRWLTLYVHMHADPYRTDLAQQWLGPLGATLSADQRAEAERWVTEFRERQANSKND